MAPLPSSLSPRRWNLGQHLCIPEVPALRKITDMEEKITIPKGKSGVLLCRSSHYRLSHPGCGGWGSGILGLSETPSQWSEILESSAWEKTSELSSLPLSPCFPYHLWSSKTWLTAGFLKDLNSTPKDTGA